jgi:hypothetical protein
MLRVLRTAAARSAGREALIRPDRFLGTHRAELWHHGDRPSRPTQRPGGAAVVGTAELDAPSGPALRDARDVADGSAVGVALPVLVTEGFVVAVGSSVGIGDSSAGARSSTRPTDVPVSPLISVDPFSSSSPVTTIRPSTKTMAVAPIQRPHGRRRGSSGEVVPPAPIRLVGPPPEPTCAVGASDDPSPVLAGSAGRSSSVGWSPCAVPAGGIRGIGTVSSAAAADARRRDRSAATVSWVRLSECSYSEVAIVLAIAPMAAPATVPKAPKYDPSTALVAAAPAPAITLLSVRSTL